VCHIASLAAVATDTIDAQPPAWSASILDITDRVEADEARAQSAAAAFAMLQDQAGDGGKLPPMCCTTSAMY